MAKVNRAPIGGLESEYDFKPGEFYEHLETGEVYLCGGIEMVSYTYSDHRRGCSGQRIGTRHDLYVGAEVLIHLESGRARLVRETFAVRDSNTGSHPAEPFGEPGMFRPIKAEITVAFNGPRLSVRPVETVDAEVLPAAEDLPELPKPAPRALPGRRR